MKFVSRMALGAALALTAVAVQPLGAKDKKPKEDAAAPAAPAYKLSKPVRDAIIAAQTALKANDLATAETKINEARAAATNNDEHFVVGNVALDLAKAKKDVPAQGKAVEEMLATGQVPAANLANFELVVAQLAYQAKDFPKAEHFLELATKDNVADVNAYALLAEAKNQQGRPADAIATLEAAIAKQKAAGQAVPSEWYGRGISIGYAAKLAPQVEHLTQEWVAAYPSASNWRDSLITYRDLNKVDPETDLDIMRLMRTAGALKGEGDYMEYVQATYLRFPGEANAVIDEGVATSNVNLATNKNAAEVKGLVKGKIAADKSSTEASAANAKAGKMTGKATLGVADALYGYGDYALAVDVYKAALQKPDLDKNVVNTRLGAALARAGQKDEAKAAFAAVTGQRQGLARYWTVWLDQKAA